MKKFRPFVFFVMLIALGFSIWFINPIREMPLEDDWFYSLMVKNLLETGRYLMHPYAAANSPFHVLWGGFFSLVGGYSFSTLRMSVLVLSLIGMIVFYLLAKENDIDKETSILLTLAYISSPLVLRFSFNFMTDVPMLVCLMAALVLYIRAVRVGSFPLIFVGSLVASAAILTRQTGAAVVPGLFMVWLVDPKRKERILFYLVGLFFPSIAAGWQYVMINGYPNFAAHRALHLQHIYQSNLGIVLTGVFYRLVAILHYLALFSLPLVLTAWLETLFSKNWSLFHKITIPIGPLTILTSLAVTTFIPGSTDLAKTLMLGGMGASLVSIICLVVSRTLRREELKYPPPLKKTDSLFLTLAWVLFLMATAGIVVLLGSPMPFGGFNFDLLRGQMPIRGFVTFITSVGGILLARMFVIRYFDREIWIDIPHEQKTMDFTALFSLLFLLPFWFFGDEYILPLLPICLIVAGRHLKKGLEKTSMRFVFIGVCLTSLSFSAVETRGVMESDEAMWKGGEFLRGQGVEPEDVYHVDDDSTYRYWRLYNSHFFEQLLDESGYNDNPSPTVANWAYNDHYAVKEKKWAINAKYWVTKSSDPSTWSTSIIGPPINEKWVVMNKIAYESYFLRRKFVYVMKKEEGKGFDIMAGDGAQLKGKFK